jgi:taurine dioxygenase
MGGKVTHRGVQGFAAPQAVGHASFVRVVSAEDVRDVPGDQVRRLVVDHKVLVIRQRNNTLGVEGFVSLMKSLGTPVLHPLRRFSLPGHPEIIKISNLYQGGAAVGVHEGGTYWHTDMSYKERKGVLTALYSVMEPASRGVSATEFVDCEAAYRVITAGVRSGSIECPGSLAGRWGAQVRHRFGNRDAARDPGATTQRLTAAEAASLEPGVMHPLVLNHPLTGRPALYAVAATSVGIDGVSEEESVRVLTWLFEMVLEHAPRYVHHYKTGDVVIWDNLSTLHRGVPIDGTDDPRECRLLHRMNVEYV